MHLKEQLGILVIILEMCKGTGWCSGVHIGALEGEIAILTCNKCKENASWSELQNSGYTVEWSVNTSSGFLKLTQTEKVFFELNSLGLLGVTLNNTGVYKCTLRNETHIVESEQLELEVYKGKCYNSNYEYLRSSFVDQSTNLICPEMELFSSTKHRVTWVKDCDKIITSENKMHIDRTTKIHSGHYTCIYSVEYDGKEYNISKTINLVVKDSPESLDPKMTFPIGTVAVEVEIGKETTINCTAILYKDDPFVTLYWKKNDSFVSMCEDNHHVCSEDGTGEHTEKEPQNSYQIMSPLIFKNVQEEHLNMKYDCILSSTTKSGTGSIILIKKKVITDISHSSFSSGIIMVVVLMITIVTVIVICVLLKVDIVLFYRAFTGKDETIGDFKEYDAYVTYDKAGSTSSCAEEERTFALEVLPQVLEEQLGYQLCIYERDVLPGGAFVDGVLEYIEKSRRLIMILSEKNMDSERQYELVTGLHNALVDRKIKIILIEYKPLKDLGSLPESLQLLVKSNGTVKWKDSESMKVNSRFWKKVQYLMPAKKHVSSDPEEVKML
ncbi:interleukin-18 receptor 1-like [Acipenser ruthenus]|uniref:interleukin-18 receptor 1-like n=1 Tax=Acipenser ruthenus TaxID=7906 RepID=UPI00145AE5E1|nr:interleukin-18 receptor 1-like [Acipenser ruthenus]XP_033868291.3 interleukin-18 receptor 1-like [Acipenser ruthenus]